VRLELPRAGWKLAVGSVPHSPGWRARDGSGAVLRTVRVHGAFLGVLAGPGTDRVELRYEPPGFRLGAALCVGALVLLGVARGRRRSAG
jgi:uncharacterized membrane protein YfhO